MRRTIREEFERDLLNLTSILEAGDRPFVAPGSAKDREEKPAWQKEVNEDTILNDCNATNCQFYNEGFKNQCMLNFIAVDVQHGCQNFKERPTTEDDDSIVDTSL